MDINQLIDEAREAMKVPTDYALAKAIGMDNKRLYDYRHGKTKPDAYAATRLALACGRDPMAVIAEIEAAAAKTERRRSFWRDFLSSASRSGRNAAALLLGCIVSLSAAAPAATGIQCRIK